MRPSGIAALLFCAAVAPAPASDAPPRVASINLCTDALALAFADPAQIVGLSPYARDPVRAVEAARAKPYRRLSGDAEDVLALKPDLVLAGRFTKRATREMLKAQGLRVEEFDAARSVEDAEAQMRRMGALLGHAARAGAAVAELEEALARAKRAAARRPLRVLAVSRRGWVSGRDSLVTSLLAAVGLDNAGVARTGGFMSLEAIVAAKPDLLLVSEADDGAEDQGRAFLLHPALEKLYPPEKRIVVPERFTVCGGPALTQALDRLTAEIERVAAPMTQTSR